MKKIYLSLLIIGFSLLGFSQDKVYDEPDFSTFPPAGWSVLNDQGTSGTGNNWIKSCYPMVKSDNLAQQEEWLISPTIACTAGTAYQISFDYRTSVYDANSLVYLLMSLDNGATWTPSPFTSDYVWTKPAVAANYWYNSGTISINTAVGNSIKLAFVYYNTSPVTDGYFAVDNILIEEFIAGYLPFKNYTFEAGITAAGWTTKNTPAPGSSQHFGNKWLGKVESDGALLQDEWLITDDYIISDNAKTSVTIALDWYALLNTMSNGARLYASTDHGVTFPDYIGDISYFSTDTRTLTPALFNLNSYKGDTVMFLIKFENNITNTDFFLNSFKLSQVFDGVIQNDAKITLGALDSMIYPVLDKYHAVDPNGIKEGFWQVAPVDWTLTHTAGATWRRGANVGVYETPHDYTAHIDTVGADKATMNETLTSQTIDIKYPSVGASYDLSFEWRTETNLNCGLNTDPNLGPGATYDFADVVMEIRTNNGTTWSAWTKIWQEDDEAILTETTSATATVYTSAWANFQDYLNYPGKWYKATLNITQYAVGNKRIEVRFNYKGNGEEAGYFDLDNFYIIRNNNPQFILETAVPVSATDAYHIDYTNVPLSQIINPVKLGARITNYGIKDFTDENLTFVINGNTYGYKTVKKSDFTTWPSTKYLEADQRAVEFASGINLVSGTTYSVTSSGTINGNSLSSTQTFTVDPVLFTKYDNNWTADSLIKADTISGGRGTVFEIKNKDKVDKVSLHLGAVTTTSEFYMNVIQLSNPNSTTGTVVYTSPRKVLASGYNTFENDFTLEPGFYAFMFNQTDKNDFEIGVDIHSRKGKIARGNSSGIYYNKSEACELLVNIELAPNTTPEIVTKFTNNKQTVVAGEAVNLKFTAIDNEGDSLFWPAGLRIITPKWLGSWMSFTDAGDGTLTIGGTPTSEYLGTSNVSLTVQDARGATRTYAFDLEVLSETAFMTPDFTELFTGTDGTVPLLWITRDDYANIESNYHWQLLTDQAHIYGEYGKEQDEWLISPPVYLPQTTASSDTAYHLEFDWKVMNFDYFCGGISGVLGSSKEVPIISGTKNTFNKADVTLMISTDQGATWSTPIWKEDSPELVAPVTEGILGGKNWAYISDHLYTSVIDLTAYVGKKVMFAFRYQSRDADYTNNRFTLDNFKVLINHEVDISISAHRNYQYIPSEQIDMTKGLTFDAFIENKGWSIPSGAKYTIECPEKGYFSSGNIDAAFFASGNVQKISYTFIPDSIFDKWYYFNVKVEVTDNNPSGLTSHSVNTYVSNSAFGRELGGSRELKTFGAYDGIGTVYEFTQPDDLDYVSTNFGNVSPVPYSISVIKLASVDATTGELIATLNDNNGNPLTTADATSFFRNDKDINTDLRINPGFYAVIINQVNPLDTVKLKSTDNKFDTKEFLRGNANKLYNEPDDRGTLYSYLGVPGNDLPYFVESTVQDEAIYAGQLFTRKIRVEDNSPYGTISLKALMLPSWLTLTADGDGVFTLTGTPTIGVTGTQDILLQACDGFSKSNDIATPDNSDGLIILTIKAGATPDFIEPFDGTAGNVPFLWITRNDYSKTGSSYFWELDGSSQVNVEGDPSNEQDEWLISPPVSLPKTSLPLDTAYRLEFDWRVMNFDYFCGGVENLLGTSKTVNGIETYNYADVTLLVSTDMGSTWSDPIWKEDSPDLVAPVTKGIYGGKSWTYEDNTKYTSVIDLSAYVGKSVMFAFRYTSKYANNNENKFMLDNFKVLINNPVDVSVYARTAYKYIPGQQLDMAKGITFDAFIENKGRKILPGATYTIECPETKYSETNNLDEAFFATGNVQKVSYTFIPDTGLYKTYNFAVKVVADSNLLSDPTSLTSHTITTNVTQTSYSKIQSADRQVKTLGAVDGLGVVYELTQPDDLYSVYTWFGGQSNGFPYSISIIKLASGDAITGDLIATIDDNDGTKLTANGGMNDIIGNDADFDGKPLRLEPGFYAVMIDQLDELKPLYIYCTNNTFDSKEFIRGNAKKLYNESDDQGSIYANLNFMENKAPVFVKSNVRDESIYDGQLFTRNIQVKDENPYGTITMSALTLPSWLTLTANGNGLFTLTGTPTSDFVGAQNILLQASDGFNKTDDLTTDDDEDGLIILTVKENPAPVFTSTPPTEAHQGVAFEYTALASDMFNETFTITAPLLPAWLTATVSTGSLKLSGTPAEANLGNNVVKLLATDASGMTSQQIFNINVFANASPVFMSWPGLTAKAGTIYTYQVLCSDDNAGSILTLEADAALPTWLTLTPTGNGMATLSGTPTVADTFDVSLSVTDPVGAKAIQSFSIVVTSNEAPLITSTEIVEGTEDVLYEYDVTATDADGNFLTFETPGLPDWLTFTVTGNGKARLQGVPTQNNVGNSLVTINVSDGSNTTTQTFTIVVAEVNDAPVIASETKGTATEGELFSLSVSATDEENSPLAFNAVLPAWLALVDNMNGTARISGIPGTEQVGDIIISVSVSDGSLTTDQVIGLTIKGVNKVNEPVSPEINLFPNPSNGKFALDKVEGYKVFVFNSAGVVVLQIENAILNQKIDLSKYGSGNYIVKVMSKNKVISTRQITVIK